LWIAIGRELIAAMAQNAPEPSGRQIIDNASIRGINREGTSRPS
jgi:hypothetical protein